MSVVKDLTTLALTRMHGGVCTAGLDPQGRWVRPVRPPGEPRSDHAGITDYCLLPLDFFHGGHSHIENLAITRFYLSDHAPCPPHTEDWLLDLRNKPQLIRKLSPDEQAAFLEARAEADLSVLKPFGDRSLGLFRVDRFTFTFTPNQSGDDITVRAAFAIAGQEVGPAGCTDLRMRALGRKLLEKSGGAPRTLGDADFGRHGKEVTYLAVGLSRLYHGKHWMIVVGVHTVPELAVEVDYARL